MVNQSLFRLAKMYQEGDGLKKDLAQAQWWHDMARANTDLYEGQFQLGLNHVKNKEYAMALEQFKSLDRLGYAKAQNRLGEMYYDGRSVPKDYKEADKYYRKAATQNYAPAQFNLGYMYKHGNGVDQNDQETKTYKHKTQHKIIHV